jgi:hypothetical protein
VSPFLPFLRLLHNAQEEPDPEARNLEGKPQQRDLKSAFPFPPWEEAAGERPPAGKTTHRPGAVPGGLVCAPGATALSVHRRPTKGERVMRVATWTGLSVCLLLSAANSTFATELYAFRSLKDEPNMLRRKK